MLHQQVTGTFQQQAGLQPGCNVTSMLSSNTLHKNGESSLMNLLAETQITQAQSDPGWLAQGALPVQNRGFCQQERLQAGHNVTTTLSSHACTVAVKMLACLCLHQVTHSDCK